MYDLVVKGGRVVDPGQGLDGPMDIGVSNGRIAAVEPAIDDPEAARVIDVRGRIVIPGMIDLHVHFIQGAGTPGVNEIAAPPDLAGVHSGVTTLLDAGTTRCVELRRLPSPRRQQRQDAPALHAQHRQVRHPRPGYRQA